MPNSPTNPRATTVSKDSITFAWNAPKDTSTPTYGVTLNSSFWGQSWNYTTSDTTFTFLNLTSGTNYAFSVYAIADGQESAPEDCANFTGKIFSLEEKLLTTWHLAGVSSSLALFSQVAVCLTLQGHCRNNPYYGKLKRRDFNQWFANFSKKTSRLKKALPKIGHGNCPPLDEPGSVKKEFFLATIAECLLRF